MHFSQVIQRRFRRYTFRNRLSQNQLLKVRPWVVNSVKMDNNEKSSESIFYNVYPCIASDF